MMAKAATPSQRSASEEREGRVRRGMDPQDSTASGALLPHPVEDVACVLVDSGQPGWKLGLPTSLVDHDPAHAVAAQDGRALGGGRRRLEKEEPGSVAARAVVLVRVEGDVPGRR